MQLLFKTEDQTWVVAGSSEQLAEKAGPVCGGGLLSGEINVDNCNVDGSLSSSILSKISQASSLSSIMCQTGSLSSKLFRRGSNLG